MTRGIRILLALALGTFVAACGGAAGPTPSAATVELTIYAAASLKGAIEQAADAFEAASPGTKVTVSTDSSSTLETQIEQGAPADVFLSADTTNPQKLIDGGFADGPAVAFAGNELTIIVPLRSSPGVEDAADLGEDGLRIVAAGDEVPITKYAGQVVTRLAGLAGYPEGFEAAYAANVVSKEDNVKAVVAKIELGEGDAALVYVTDAKASTKVTTVPLPGEANVPATYAGVVVKASASVAIAKAFLDWLAGPEGQAILAPFGFVPPPA